MFLFSVMMSWAFRIGYYDGHLSHVFLWISIAFKFICLSSFAWASEIRTLVEHFMAINGKMDRKMNQYLFCLKCSKNYTSILRKFPEVSCRGKHKRNCVKSIWTGRRTHPIQWISTVIFAPTVFFRANAILTVESNPSRKEFEDFFGPFEQGCWESCCDFVTDVNTLDVSLDFHNQNN